MRQSGDKINKLMKACEKAVHKYKKSIVDTRRELSEEEKQVIGESEVTIGFGEQIITLYTFVTILRNPQARVVGSEERTWLKQLQEQLVREGQKTLCPTKILEQGSQILGITVSRDGGGVEAPTEPTANETKEEAAATNAAATKRQAKATDAGLSETEPREPPKKRGKLVRKKL